MRFEGFIGASYESRSAVVDTQRCVNLYPEKIESGSGATDWALYSTPGLSLLSTLPTSPVRGIYVGENRCFVVSGSKLYEVNASGAPIGGRGGNQDLGDVGSDGLPVQIFPSGTGSQLMIVSAGHVYIDTGTALVQPIYTSAEGYANVTPGLDGYTSTCSVGDDGVTVTRLSGDTWDAAMIGRYVGIVQSGWNYGKKVVAVADADTLTLEEPIPAGAGPFNLVQDPQGALVTLVYGDVFDPSMERQVMMLNGTPYVVGYYLDENHVRLYYDWDVTLSDATYSIANSGTVNTKTISGVHEVQWVSGDKFVPALVGAAIWINYVSYTVAAYKNPELITLTATAGTQTDVSYAASISVTAAQGAFLDGYFVVNTPGTGQINISRLNNGLRWDPLDFANTEAYPDATYGLLADHEELWLFGSQSIEVWRNTGNADFPLERDPGAMVHMGIAAPWSHARLPGGPGWLGSDARGGPVAYRAQGYVPVRISTHAIEQIWRGYSTVADAESFTYVDDGHFFWILQFPAAGATWAFDATTGQWHQRAYDTSLGRWRGRCQVFVFGKRIVGDYGTGKLYVMSHDNTDDAGTAIKRVRRAPHLGQELKRITHTQFTLHTEHAAALTTTLSWSDDYGTHWVTPRAPHGNRVGSGDSSRVMGYVWRRLGAARDRIYEVVITGGSRVSLAGAYLDLQAGG